MKMMGENEIGFGAVSGIFEIIKNPETVSQSQDRGGIFIKTMSVHI
jgi:hypothetical protein